VITPKCTRNIPFYFDPIDTIFKQVKIKYSNYFQKGSRCVCSRSGNTIIRSGYLHNLAQDRKEPNDFENSKCLQEMAEHFRDRDFGGFILKKFNLVNSFEG